MTTTEAYEICEGIARREAKNFYYAFRVLPQHKRNAICAVYAFMRRADDITDDETMPVAERRLVMAQWMGAWRAARAGGGTDDAVFVALNDTQRLFAIPDALLEELVQGTTMDLAEAAPEGVLLVDKAGQEYQVYESFDALYRYCYLVASVVGLVCIKIFGYSDPVAEELAEKTGIAFQLTNILRDVKEDVERGRVYLPYEDLQAAGVLVEHVALIAAGVMDCGALRPVIAKEALRAREYYGAADELIPMLDVDSRAAMGVLVDIYSGLLGEIERAEFDVFTRRIRVSTPTKLRMLAKGMLKTAKNRLVSGR